MPVVQTNCPECHTSVAVEGGCGTHSIIGVADVRTASVAPGISCPLCAHGFAWLNGKAANLSGRRAQLVGTPPPPTPEESQTAPISISGREPHDYSPLTYQQLRVLASENDIPARGKRREIEKRLQDANVAPPTPTEPES